MYVCFSILYYYDPEKFNLKVCTYNCKIIRKYLEENKNLLRC